MKKLFLTFALLLTVSFAFATSEVEKTSILDIDETIEIINSIELTEVDFIIDTYTSQKNTIKKIEYINNQQRWYCRTCWTYLPTGEKVCTPWRVCEDQSPQQ